MKFKIQSLETQIVNTKFGDKAKFRFVSDGQTFDAWSKKGFTDHFKVGYEFEAELSGKPYKGIDTIAWPKQQSYGAPQFNPSNNQLNDAIKMTLERIEKKLDKLLGNVTYTLPNANTTLPKDIPQIPYEDSPFPRDEDQY